MADELANELVKWFNAVDAAYRSDLRELNELNFARFDAKLEQRFAQQDAKWEQRFAQQDSKLEQRLAEQDLKLDRGLAEVRSEFRSGLQALKVDLVRWLFPFWTGTLIALAAFLLAVLRSR